MLMKIQRHQYTNSRHCKNNVQYMQHDQIFFSFSFIFPFRESDHNEGLVMCGYLIKKAQLLIQWEDIHYSLYNYTKQNRGILPPFQL